VRKLASWLLAVLPPTFRGRRYLQNLLIFLFLGKSGKRAGIGVINFPFLPFHWSYYFGVYKPQTVELIASRLQPGEVFLDVGANVGYFSALALNRVGRTGVVCAFEPEAGNFRRLAELKSMNPDYDFRIQHRAVSDSETRCILFLSENPGWHSLDRDFSRNTRTGTQEVETISLDEFCRRESFAEQGRIRLLKIDVEGAELQVLRGAVQLLAEQWAQLIFIEVMPVNFPMIRNILTEAGYCLHEFRSQAKSWQPIICETLTEQANLLAVPASRQ
jgi:FkbM family methyltransferase